MKVDFDRERAWWDAKAPKEDVDFGGSDINRALRWRELERHLKGVRSILDVGGGTGAFSIPLARRGFKVVHVDFSPEMIRIARRKAAGIGNLSFVEANSTDLSVFPDRSFDLVLNMDGAITFCGSMAGRAIRESCRVTRKTFVAAVANRLLMIPIMAVAGFPRKIYKALGPMVKEGLWHQDQYAENRKLGKGSTQDYFGAFKAFLPDELEKAISACGLRVLRCGALGSLAYLCEQQKVESLPAKGWIYRRFLDLCEEFDRLMPGGPGTRQRAGLIAVARR
jgi:SAM-dependent methyltransferase